MHRPRSSICSTLAILGATFVTGCSGTVTSDDPSGSRDCVATLAPATNEGGTYSVVGSTLLLEGGDPPELRVDGDRLTLGTKTQLGSVVEFYERR